MKIDTYRLAASLALATAVIWIICSLLVAAMPALMMPMAGHMLHAQLAGHAWHLTWTGFLVGLVAWVAWAAAAGWLVGTIYNRLGGRDAT